MASRTEPWLVHGGIGNWQFRASARMTPLVIFAIVYVRPLVCRMLGHRAARYSELDVFASEQLCARCFRSTLGGRDASDA